MNINNSNGAHKAITHVQNMKAIRFDLQEEENREERKKENS